MALENGVDTYVPFGPPDWWDPNREIYKGAPQLPIMTDLVHTDPIRARRYRSEMAEFLFHCQLRDTNVHVMGTDEDFQENPAYQIFIDPSVTFGYCSSTLTSPFMADRGHTPDYEPTYIGPYVGIHKDVQISENVWVGPGSRILSRAIIHNSTIIGPHNRIEQEASVGAMNVFDEAVIIGQGAKTDDDVRLGHHTVVYARFIGRGVRAGHHNTFGYDARIGFGCSFGNHVQVEGRIGDKCSFGDRVVVDGRVDDYVKMESGSKLFYSWVGDRTQIGEGAVIAGAQVVHVAARANFDGSWGKLIEGAPTIGRRAFVGAGAVVIGGVTIGEGAYVAAKALVRENVPPDTVVINKGQQIHKGDWRGRELLTEPIAGRSGLYPQDLAPPW